MIKKVCDGLAENEHSIHAEWWALATCWFRWWICKHAVQRDSFCVLGYMHMIWNNLSFDWATLVRFLSNLWHRAFLTVLTRIEVEVVGVNGPSLCNVKILYLYPWISGPTHSSVYTSLKSTVLNLHSPKLLQSPCVCLVACVQSQDYGNDNEIDSPLSPRCFL